MESVPLPSVNSSSRFDRILDAQLLLESQFLHTRRGSFRGTLLIMSSAPITTRGHLGSGSGGQRRSSRQRIGPLVYVGLGPSNGGFPINVSEDGLAFQGIQRIQRDQSVPVKFKLPDLDRSVETAGQIIWVNAIGTGGGLRFVDLPEDCRVLIRNWILSENEHARADADVGGGLGKTKGKSLFVVPPQDARVDAAAPVPAAKVDSVSDGAGHTCSVAAPTSSTAPRTQPKVSGNAAAMPGPAISAFVLGSENKGSEKERNRFNRPALLIVVGIAVIAVAAAITLEFGQGALLDRMRGAMAQLFSGSTSGALWPSATASDTRNRAGDPVAGSSVSAPAVSVPVSNAAPHAIVATPVADASNPGKTSVQLPAQRQSRPAAAVTRVAVSAPKRAATPLIGFKRPLPPSTIAKLEAPDVAPPAIAPPFRPQLATLLPTGLPEPPALTAIRPIQQTSKLEPARLVVHRDPVYPSMAKTGGYSGAVELLFTIGADGKVHNIRVMKGTNLLTQAAVDAVKSWRFQPARRDGIPVESESSTVINFKLN
jgi:TonB family protein